MFEERANTPGSVSPRLHRAVLAVVVKRAAGYEEMNMMNKLVRMSGGRAQADDR